MSFLKMKWLQEKQYIQDREVENTSFVTEVKGINNSNKFIIVDNAKRVQNYAMEALKSKIESYKRYL